MDVKLEDQQKINMFSRLNSKLHELQAKLAAKKASGHGMVGVGPPQATLSRQTQAAAGHLYQSPPAAALCVGIAAPPASSIGCQ